MGRKSKSKGQAQSAKTLNKAKKDKNVFKVSDKNHSKKAKQVRGNLKKVKDDYIYFINKVFKHLIYYYYIFL